jgi:hypothetical protein
MSVTGSIAVGLVSLWLLATIGYQLPVFRGMLGRWNEARILPSWSFFAPSPATRDSHVVFRDLLRDGTATIWAPAAFFPSRTLLHTVWHPAKRPRKILRDASKTLKQTARRSASKGVVQCSLPYLLILHYCIAQYPRPSNAMARQFAVVETSGREERRIWITFISGFHRF